MRKMFLAGISSGIMAGLLATLFRPARFRTAWITAIIEGKQPVAVVALRHGIGMRPTSVIVDVHCAAGIGSATITGDRTQTQVALARQQAMGTRITTTATYRYLGQALTVRQEFAGGA